jgi:hypothetical protein
MNFSLNPASLNDAYPNISNNNYIGDIYDGYPSLQSNNIPIEPIKYSDLIEKEKILKYNDISNDNIKISDSKLEYIKNQSINISKTINTIKARLVILNELLKTEETEYANLEKLKTDFDNGYTTYLNKLISTKSFNVTNNNELFEKTTFFLNKLEESHNKLIVESKNNIDLISKERSYLLSRLNIFASFISDNAINELGEPVFNNIENIANKCKICIENDINCVFNPCGHTSCESCFNSLNNNKCHICRQYIINKIKLFIS